MRNIIRNYFVLLFCMVVTLFTSCSKDSANDEEIMLQNSYSIVVDGNFGEDVTVNKIENLVCQAYNVQSINSNIFLEGKAITCDAKIRDLANKTINEINKKINESEIMPQSNYSISFTIKREDTKQVVTSFTFDLKKQVYHYVYAFNKQQLSGVTIELDL